MMGGGGNIIIENTLPRPDDNIKLSRQAACN
jgi:hypothetical protein